MQLQNRIKLRYVGMTTALTIATALIGGRQIYDACRINSVDKQIRKEYPEQYQRLEYMLAIDHHKIMGCRSGLPDNWQEILNQERERGIENSEDFIKASPFRDQIEETREYSGSFFMPVKPYTQSCGYKSPDYSQKWWEAFASVPWLIGSLCYGLVTGHIINEFRKDKK